MNKTLPITRHLILLAIAVLLTVIACHPSPRSLTVVTGKVVYGISAIEGADIKVLKVEGGKWKVVVESRSGYHGSFRLHLAEGTYRIEARTTMRSGDHLLTLAGALDPLFVDGKHRRMDQVVVELEVDQL